jgi:hypothetical protein
MKKILLFLVASSSFAFSLDTSAQSQKKSSKSEPKYDTIIVKRVPKPVAKPAVVKKEIVIPTPEFINQPYYYDKDDNNLIKLENTTAAMATKKKTLGLKGAKQSLTMDKASSKVRFNSRKDIVFIIKTSGDVIDLTSYIKLYRFTSVEEKREVTIAAKEGMLNDKDEGKGGQMEFSVKMISKDNYMIQFTMPLEAGEYGFVWMKNMELKQFDVFAFGIDWKNSD